jgi:RHS repeat-associated protein
MTGISSACGTTVPVWNARNRLVGITGFKPDCSAFTATFKYDALGRRIEKTVNNRTIQYLYDGMDIVQEIENGVPTVNYIRTMNIDEPLMRIAADNTVRYYHTDALGSVIALSDATGAVKTRYAYDAFGNVAITGEASDNVFQYTGRENDNTGLYYYRARYYSPELQRFISQDPIRFKGGINWYSYVGNNPLNKRDPRGLYDIDDAWEDLGGQDEPGMTRLEYEWAYLMGQLECTAKCVLEVAIEDAAVHAILEGAAHEAASAAAKGLLKKGSWFSVGWGGYKAIKCTVTCGCPGN